MQRATCLRQLPNKRLQQTGAAVATVIILLRSEPLMRNERFSNPSTAPAAEALIR